MTPDKFGFRRLVRFGPVEIVRIGSWNRPFYRRGQVWGTWRSFTIRYRDWLVTFR
jgi:hypothetical protein